MTDSNSKNAACTHPDWIARSKLLLDSYETWVGHALIPRSGAIEDSRLLFDAPFVVVAHGAEADPLLNYGNATALNLWQMTLDQFLGTPSRKTAEPVHRDERADLLNRTKRDGFIDDYSGVRIASTGQRFRIQEAIVWNLVNAAGDQVGQAATFCDWEVLGQSAD